MTQKKSGPKVQEMQEFKNLQKKYLEGKNKEDKERLIAFIVGRAARNRSDAFILPVCKILIEARDADAFYVASFIQNTTTRIRLRRYLKQQFVEKDKVFLPQKVQYPSLAHGHPEPQHNTVSGEPQEQTPPPTKNDESAPQRIFRRLIERGMLLFKRSPPPRA